MCHSLPLADHSACAPDLRPWADPGAWSITEAGAVALAAELLRRAGDPTGALRLATEAGRRVGVEDGWRMCMAVYRAVWREPALACPPARAAVVDDS